MKSKYIIILLLVVSMVSMLWVLNGCSNKLITRTYKLHEHDAGFAAISNVLDEEWNKHSIMSHADVKENLAVVKTTYRGHRKIEAALKLR